MAHTFFLRLLLLAALISTTTLRLISATETPPPSQTPPLIPTPSPRPPFFPPPPPPPPPTPPITPQNQLNNIIDALIGAGDFAGWANILSSADPSSLPMTATFFIPSNDAISNLPTATTVAGINFDPFLIPYHIVPQRLTFTDLQQFSTGTRLPTLLPSKYLIITDNATSHFAIDDSQVTHPDIFVNTGFSVHGITKVLDYTVYGGGVLLSPPPPGNVNSTTAEYTPAPPKEWERVFPGEITVGLRSSASYTCRWFGMVFSVASAVLAFKILKS